MEWFNVFGLVFMLAIMVPNIIFAIKGKNDGGVKNNNRLVEAVEQVGRFGCLAFMIINIPKTYFGFWSENAFAVYLVVDTVLIFAYCCIWIVCWKKDTVFKALALSIIPSAVFLLSGTLSRSVLLCLSALLFAPAHIYISYNNSK